ncbi:MAG: DUF418 domain-containing protein [Wenzhouxiangella sp.]|jgi:uncharacterized protein|nr:DUF418 domain-containing protein [Wenzhouxiangella sp.]
MAGRNLRPVSDRLIHLDVLRGFALLGILLVNFEWFLRPMQAIMLGTEPGMSFLSQVADALVTTLGEGKFYPLFSILFGAGFALMAERALKKAAPFWGVYLRRLLILAGLGLIHTLFIWAGDILLIYAIAAIIMILLFRKTPVSRLWKWGLFFVSVPVLLMWLSTASIMVASTQPEVGAEIMESFAADDARLREFLAEAKQIHETGSFADNVGLRIDDTIFKLQFFLFWATPVIGYFLIGRWLVVSDRLLNPQQHAMYFRRWRSRGLLFGLALSAAATWVMWDISSGLPSVQSALGTTLGIFGGLLLALGYLSMITLSSERLSFLAPVGQMALSNYLAQSLVWTWVIYGYGLGLWGEVPRWASIPLALAFFALQVVISQWWMTRFRFGPAEWLWRTLTYGERQPMRR